VVTDLENEGDLEKVVKIYFPSLADTDVKQAMKYVKKSPSSENK